MCWDRRTFRPPLHLSRVNPVLMPYSCFFWPLLSPPPSQTPRSQLCLHPRPPQSWYRVWVVKSVLTQIFQKFESVRFQSPSRQIPSPYKDSRLLGLGSLSMSSKTPEEEEEKEEEEVRVVSSRCVASCSSSTPALLKGTDTSSLTDP